MRKKIKRTKSTFCYLDKKVAFLINKRLFEMKVIYFGLCNLPEIFQWIRNSIF